MLTSVSDRRVMQADGGEVRIAEICQVVPVAYALKHGFGEKAAVDTAGPVGSRAGVRSLHGVLQVAAD